MRTRQTNFFPPKNLWNTFSSLSSFNRISLVVLLAAVVVAPIAANLAINANANDSARFEAESGVLSSDNKAIIGTDDPNASGGKYVTLNSTGGSGGGGTISPMPLISRGKPAFASSGTASSANDSTYDTIWRSSQTISTSTPAWLAYDLSSVPAAQRTQVIVGWYNDPITYPYDHVMDGSAAYNSIKDYTIQVNPAPGGTSAPTSGWVTKATVSGNVYHSRTHLVDMTGNNWIRISVTAPDGSSGNNDAGINMDVHDAHNGPMDSWIFYGDSVTANAMGHENGGEGGVPAGTNTFSQMINASKSTYYPSYEEAGIGGTTSQTIVDNINTWLPLFPGHYVALDYGANDANGCGGSTTTYYNNMASVVQTIIKAGKVPVVAKFHWAPVYSSCGQNYMDKIDQLYSAFPQVVHGPDLWTYFKNNPSLISSDNLHPSTAGNAALRQQWANAMLANVYNAAGGTGPTPTPVPSTAPTNTPAPSATPTPGSGGGTTGFSNLHVSGNKLINDQGQTVVLHGVDYAGTEYACIQGWGIFDGPSDAASVQAMRSWGINTVLIPINEDCWLGINGVSSQYGGTNYQTAIKNYVALLESNNIYPVIAYMWGAPGTQQALDHPQIPDADHAPATWTGIANTFKGDNKVVFRLQEEPHDITWQCWRDGGPACNVGYTAVGMQSLVNTIRATGATNVLALPGIDWSNTMDQFLTYKPTDSLNSLMGMVDVYPNGNSCGSVTCYNSQYAPVIAQIPFAAGEFGESVNANVCGTTGIDTLMNWFDQHGAGYIAWTWDTWGTDCGNLSLITDFNGAAHSPNGVDYKNHLHALGLAQVPAKHHRLAQTAKHAHQSVFGALFHKVTGVVSSFATIFSKPSYAQTTGRQTVSAVDVGWAPTSNMPWADLNQVSLFALQTTNGTGLDTSLLSGVDPASWAATAHAHGVSPAYIQIGGIDDQNWQNACNDTNRAGFVSNVVNYVVSHGFDGLELDIEDNLWSAQGPPSPAMTTCIQALATAAHAATSQAGKKLLVSEDVTTPWMGSWVAPSAAYIDQFNLMTFGETVTQVNSDVQTTINQGLPAAKSIIGIDVDDYPQPSGGCGQYAQYSQTHGLTGTFVWTATSDTGNSCLNGLAAQVPAPTTGPSPTPGPTNTSMSPTPTTVPCNVTPPSGTGSITINQAALPSTGGYNVFTRLMVPSSGGSYYLQIDGGCPVKVIDSLGTNSWGWVASGQVTDTGNPHNIVLYGNDQNVKVDQVLFSKSCTPNPTGDGSDCLASAPTPTTGPTMTPVPPTPTGTVTIDDSMIGTGQNQWNYTGAGWNGCTSCNETNPTVTYSNGSQHWDDGSVSSGDSATLSFTGTQIKFYGVVASHHGIGAVSIDNGPETNVDFYSPTKTGNVLLWTSPTLTNGVHTFKLRNTGTNNPSSTGTVIVVDSADVITGSSTTPTMTPVPPTNTPVPPTATPKPTNTPVPTATLTPTPVQSNGTGALNLINSASNHGVFAGNGLTISMPSGVHSGDLLIAVVGTNGAAAKWTLPAGWTKGISSGNKGAQGLNWFWKVANGTESGTTVNIKSSTWSDGGIVLMVYRGENTTKPFAGVSSRASNDNNGNGVKSATVNSVSLSNSVNVVPLILSSWQSNSATITYPSGFSSQGSANDSYDFVNVANKANSQLTNFLGTQTLGFSSKEADVETIQVAVNVGQ